MCKIVLTENTPGAALHPSLNSFKWTLFSNNTAIGTLLTVALRVVATGCCQIEISNSDPSEIIGLGAVPPQLWENSVFEQILKNNSELNQF